MALKEKIEQDLNQALKTKDAPVVSGLRLFRAALTNREIELRAKKRELTEEEVVNVLQKEVKKIKDSIEAFKQGGRQELVEKEQQELAILEKYLPEQLSEDEIKNIIKEAIQEIGEASEKSFGLVMKAVMEKVKGRADGSVVSRLVKEVLAER